MALRLGIFCNKKDRKRAFAVTNGQLGLPVTNCLTYILSRDAENFSEYQAYQGKMYHPLPYRYPFCPRTAAFHGHYRAHPGQFGSIWDTAGPILAQHNGATAAQAATTGLSLFVHLHHHPIRCRPSERLGRVHLLRLGRRRNESAGRRRPGHVAVLMDPGPQI